MASKRFLIVPEDSSAASTPLPGATMANATLLRSARFIGASSRALFLASQTRRLSGDSQERVKELAQAPADRLTARSGGGRSRHLRIELALDVALGHLGGGQHFLDLAGLPRGIEFLQPLLAELGHRFHRRLEIFARVELFRI